MKYNGIKKNAEECIIPDFQRSKIRKEKIIKKIVLYFLLYVLKKEKLLDV
jgi:hypothetical protein